MTAPSPPKQVKYLRITFWFFFLCTIAFILFSHQYLLPLESGDVVKLEMAKTKDAAASIIQEWKATGKYEIGVESITVDYILIVLYTLCIAIGCRFFSLRTNNATLMKSGIFFSYLIFLAAVCNVIENVSMAKTLAGNITEGTVFLAYAMAGIKFTTIIICLIFLVACFLIWLMGKYQKISQRRKR